MPERAYGVTAGGASGDCFQFALPALSTNEDSGGGQMSPNDDKVIKCNQAQQRGELPIKFCYSHEIGLGADLGQALLLRNSMRFAALADEHLGASAGGFERVWSGLNG
jgi:hypothetical protein